MSISELTNPFSGKIDLSDKVGLTLFTKASAGLEDGDKFIFLWTLLKKTIEEIQQANQAYFWGAFCFKIASSKDGISYNLISDYDKLTKTDVINHSKK